MERGGEKGAGVGGGEERKKRQFGIISSEKKWGKGDEMEGRETYIFIKRVFASIYT